MSLRARPAPPALLGLAVLAAAVLAGCAAPEAEPSEPVPRFGWCPSWQQGEAALERSIRLDTAERQVVEVVAPAGTNLSVPPGERTGAGWMRDGHPVDLYRVVVTNFTSTAAVELRAHNETGMGLAIRDDRERDDSHRRAFLVVDASVQGYELDIPVNPVVQGAKPVPAPVALQWRLEYDENAQYLVEPQATVQYTVTPFYRVCGVVA